MDSPSITNSASVIFFSCAVLCCATFWGPVYALEECNFPAIFNFGDSNSDTGAQSAAVFPLPLPYGRTYFGKPSGRFSDGRLIIDFIASNLSLPFLSAYLDSLGANYVAGADFAVAGATILPSNSTLPIVQLRPFYLSIEYIQFAQFVTRSQMVPNKGVVPKEEYFSQALYTIDIGQNDIGYGLLDGMTIEVINAMVPSLVDAVVVHVKALYALGARSFWIHNTGPIGCLAYILTPRPPSPDQFDEAGCAIPYNNVAQYFNTKLKEAVASLRVALPLAAITYVDIYSIKYSFFSQPEKYGFSQPLIVCCGVGVPYNYNSTIQCGDAESCLDPTTKVIWDGGHYTEAANKIVYNLILTGNFSDPPIPPSLACNRLVEQVVFI